MRLSKLIAALGLLALATPVSALALSNAGSNSKIVFARDMGGGAHDIFIANANGSSPTNLTNNAADDVDPAVSPDGTRIVFASDRAGSYNLYVINTSGTGTSIRLTATPNDERYPVWTPDGNKILFSEDSGDPTKQLDLHTVDASGANPGVLVSNDGDDIEPAVSPDTAWVNWTSNGTIWEGTAPGAGSAIQKLYPAGGQSSPTWSPISARWAFIGLGTIRVEKTDGSGYADTGVAATGRIVWAPDGSVILYGTGGGLFTVHPDGSNVVQLTASSDIAGDWVPGIANVRIPQVAGTMTLGSTLVADAGVWTGSSSFSYTYQWERCNPPGASGCQPIAGASGPTYTTTTTDLNAALRVYVTAASSAGTATAASAGTGAIGNPVSSTLPTVTGTISTGSTITATTGSVGSGLGTAPLTFTFQWLRCDTVGDHCTQIAGATNPSYVIANADYGYTLRVQVTATNTAGSATGTSLPSAVVGGLTPLNTVIPVVAGQAVIGSVLVATSGTWTGGAGIAFTYQWQRCSASGTNCQAIVGATGTSYTVTLEDAGSTLVVSVTGTNSYGIASVASLPSVIAGAVPTVPGPGAPASTVDPSVVGAPVIGLALTAKNGGFVGAGLAFAYQWQRCDTSAKNCSSIQGATKASYTPKQPDLGSTLRVVVTARNTLGSASSYSDVTSAVTAAPVAGAAGTTQSAHIAVQRGSKRGDRLVVRRGTGRVLAGAGNDTVLAADGRREVIDCGTGRDSVSADRSDVLLHCEVVRFAKQKPKTKPKTTTKRA